MEGRNLKIEIETVRKENQYLLETIEGLKKAVFDANQIAADAENANYQLQIEMQQRQISENINNALFKISNAINTTHNLKELYKAIHTTLMDVMDVSNFAIAIYDQNRDRCHFPYFESRKEDFFPVLYDISKKRGSLTREVIFSKKPVFKTKYKIYRGEGKLEENKFGLPSMAWIGVPLTIKEKVIGVMITQSYTDPDRYSLSDLDILISVSKQVALAIETKRVNTALLESEKKYKTILSSIHEGYCEIDKDGYITFTNQAMSQISGYSQRDLSYMNIAEMIHFDDKERVQNVLTNILKSGSHLTEFDYRIIRKDQSARHIGVSISLIEKDETNKGLRFVIRDIDERKKNEEELLYIAYHDSLTGLKNRKAFYEHLDKALQKAKRNGNRIALLFIDIDKFKKVNDTYGHEAGDQVLVEIAGRLNTSFRKTDFSARMGGDEFTVILDDHVTFNPAIVAQKIATILSEPYRFENKSIDFLSASIGVSIYPEDGNSGDELIKKADTAMYHAKKSQRSIIWSNRKIKIKNKF